VHLNGDESMAFGAAFIAANSSSSYKVRKVFLTQHPEFEIKLKVSPLDDSFVPPQAETEGEDSLNYFKDVTLYRQSDFLGQKKTVNLNYDRNMKVELSMVTTDDSGESREEPVVTYSLDEIEKHSLGEIAQKHNSTFPKVSLSFVLSRSQFIKLKEVKVKIDETVIEEVVPEPTKTDKTDKTDKADKEDSDSEAQEGEAHTTKEKAGSYTEPSEPEAEAEAPVETPSEKELKTTIKPHAWDVKINESLQNVRLLDEKQMKAS
jgi:hypoxia up-regulated 1